MKFFKCHSQKMKDDKIICLQDKFNDIGPDVFDGFCAEYIILADTTKIIRSYAFSGVGKCNIYLPKSISEIEPMAFENVSPETIFYCAKGSYAEQACYESNVAVDNDVQKIFALVEEQKRIAEEQQRIAEEQRRLAEEQQRKAEEERRIAEEQKRIAAEQERAKVELEAKLASERIAKEKAEAERLAREKAEAERVARGNEARNLVDALRKTIDVKPSVVKPVAPVKPQPTVKQQTSCPFCKKTLLPDDLYCAYCGKKVKNIKICKVCGGCNDVGDSYCAYCGAKN